jgi:hypothetical protein
MALSVMYAIILLNQILMVYLCHFLLKLPCVNIFQFLNGTCDHLFVDSVSRNNNRHGPFIMRAHCDDYMLLMLPRCLACL